MADNSTASMDDLYELYGFMQNNSNFNRRLGALAGILNNNVEKVLLTEVRETLKDDRLVLMVSPSMDKGLTAKDWMKKLEETFDNDEDIARAIRIITDKAADEVDVSTVENLREGVNLVPDLSRTEGEIQERQQGLIHALVTGEIGKEEFHNQRQMLEQYAEMLREGKENL